MDNNIHNKLRWMSQKEALLHKKLMYAYEIEWWETRSQGYDKCPWIDSENSRWLKEIRQNTDNGKSIKINKEDSE